MAGVQSPLEIESMDGGSQAPASISWHYEASFICELEEVKAPTARKDRRKL
jgi:hypothetical protein